MTASTPQDAATENVMLRELVDCLDSLLAAYRCGGRPNMTKLDRIAPLKRKLGIS